MIPAVFTQSKQRHFYGVRLRTIIADMLVWWCLLAAVQDLIWRSPKCREQVTRKWKLQWWSDSKNSQQNFTRQGYMLSFNGGTFLLRDMVTMLRSRDVIYRRPASIWCVNLVHVSVIIPVQKKSALLFDSLSYIYIYIYVCMYVCLYVCMKWLSDISILTFSSLIFHCGRQIH